MFVLLSGVQGIERMATGLRGGIGAPRLWHDREGNAGAASVQPRFVPEDALDTQPLVDDERVFVCQARLDNRDELLAQLGGDAAGADSSLLAMAYDRWGVECVQQLVGDFAFAVRHRDGRVVAAVDPVGTRRLYWTRIGGGIALSAQLAALLAHPDVSREPDLAALARLLDMGIDRTSTPFARIRALSGGHLLAWRAGEDVRVTRWWHPRTDRIWYRDTREYVDETRELLTRAVAAQVRSSSDVSSTLSGGLDSGAITAVAARLVPRLAAYTSIPEAGLLPSERRDWEADDRAWAAEVAALYPNIDHRLVAPAGRCTLDVLPAIHEHSWTPTKSATNLLWLDRISATAMASGSRVLLVGQHGNALFSWTGDNATWELASSGRVRASIVQAAREARARDTSVARVVGGAIRAGVRTWLRRRPRDTRPPSFAFLRADRRPSLADRRGEYALPPGTRTYWLTYVTTPRHVWAPDPVVQWGIDWRDPTTDRRLVERLLRYPQAAFRFAGRERGLARAAAEGWLPDRVRFRRARGAQVPEAPSLIAAHGSRYRDGLETMRRSAWCRELLDLDALQRVLEAVVDGSHDYLLAIALDRTFDAGLFLAKLERHA